MRDLPNPASLWRETSSEGLPSPPLSGTQEADVAIIGGGYTGLSAALRCIERGLEPVVIEAAEIGWGASGRNGGVVSTKFRRSLADIAKLHGADVARRMYQIGHEAVECVERYVEEHGIADARLDMTGNVRCAHTPAALAALEAEVETSRKLFGDTATIVLDAARIKYETGSSDFVGGVLARRAGVIHPLNYARGLARAAHARGARIFEHSPAKMVERWNGRVRVVTDGGSVSARYLVLATNGYSDLTAATAPLRTAVIPFRSAMVATAPLDASLLSTLIPEGRSYSETRRMMRWFRRVDDRILFGGRGAFGKDDSEAAYRALGRAMRQIFPPLTDVPVTHCWSGLVAMTMDSLPQVGTLDERTGFALGYNGAGIAMSSLLGRYVVDLLTRNAPDLALIGRAGLGTVPLYFLRRPVVRLVAGWYQFLDRIGR